jgi:hypothetical protein
MNGHDLAVCITARVRTNLVTCEAPFFGRTQAEIMRGYRLCRVRGGPGGEREAHRWSTLRRFGSTALFINWLQNVPKTHSANKLRLQSTGLSYNLLESSRC